MQLESEVSQKLSYLEVNLQKAQAQSFEDASDSDARLAQEQSVALFRIGHVGACSESMFEEKSSIISEQADQIAKLRSDLASRAKRHAIRSPDNVSISEGSRSNDDPGLP